MISFESPGYFMLLSLVPVGIYFMHAFSGRGGRISFSFSNWHGEAFTYRARLLRGALFIAHVCFWSAASAIIVALAGPVRTERETIYLSDALGIMIVLDESPSMSARDFLPENRFESAKQVIREFVDGRPNDAVGLVSFGRDASLRVPPTRDTQALLDRLGALKIASLGDGTAIGMGLAVATMHLERAGGAGVIVLLTDGENNAGEILPETATEIAARLGFRIYAVGIGTTGEVAVEYTDPETGRVRAGLFESRFNEELLRVIADTTGGRYYSAQSPGALNAVFRSIDRLETNEKRVRIDVRTEAIYDRFLLVAGIGLLSNFFIRSAFLREVLA